MSNAAQMARHADSSSAESASCFGGTQRTTRPCESGAGLSLNGSMSRGGSDAWGSKVGRMPAMIPAGSMMPRGSLLIRAARSTQAATAEMAFV